VTSRRAPLHGLLWAALLITWGMAGLSIWFDYSDTRTLTLERTQAAALLLEEHTRGALNTATEIATQATALVGQYGLAGIGSSREAWRELSSFDQALDYVSEIVIADAAGQALLTSRRFGPPGFSVAGEDYFPALSSGGADQVIGRAAAAQGHDAAFTLARRLAPGGAFSGTIALALPVRYFADLLHLTDLGPSGLLVIRRDDGSWIMQVPSATPVAADRGPLPVASTTIRRADGRLYALRRVPEYGLTVAASMGLDEAFQPWRGRTIRTALLLAIGTAAALLFFAAARRYAARDDAMRAALEDSNRSLSQALADKDALFREVHHRVKNNLQMVTSLLLVRRARLKDPEARAALDDLYEKVQSIGLVHRVLYQANEAERVALGAYLKELCASLAEGYGAPERGIAVAVEGDPGAALELERAIPIALTVNEIVTNAFKHAFPDGRRGRIAVTVQQEEGDILIDIADDGIGLPPGARPGTGSELIDTLLRQAGATATPATPPTGTRLTLRLPAHPVPPGQN
jgi:two-component sensor histidine kinase